MHECIDLHISKYNLLLPPSRGEVINSCSKCARTRTDTGVPVNPIYKLVTFTTK